MRWSRGTRRPRPGGVIAPPPVRLPLAVLAVAGLLGAPAALGGQATPPPEALDGVRFRTIGPAIMSGRFVDVAVVESDPYVWYAASSTGGLYKTTNNGVTFTPLFNREAVHSLGDVAIAQSDPDVVWLGTGERANRQSSSWGNGVYKSTDGGETWTHMGLDDSRHIGRIVVHPRDPNVVFVAAMGHLWGPNDERGLYRTRDGGQTWERVLFVDEDTGVVDVAMELGDPAVLYAATYQRRRRPWGFHGGGPGSGLWTSTDGGNTWTSLSAMAPDNGLPAGELGRIGISIYRSDPRIVYVSVEQGERYNASTAYEQRRAGIYRSEDRGRSWTFMSDWNPRPMYASQIMVDPSDDQRIYMMNAYSWSDDGGKTFTVPDQSLHGDDRFIWVDPGDSRHVIKADDGSIGVSYDRGVTWIYAQHLPVSQYYRVAVDTRTPYWVYGGLQDNGSWAGPNQTYRSEGILNNDWIRLGGGDGFLNLVDTTDNRTVYTESQYLGLSRLDLVTGQRTWIRPGDPEGAISARRNWTTWPDPEVPEQRLGNAMEPANWDGPFLLSPHRLQTIYAGTRRLWRSRDRGQSWESLGDHTTGVARQRLPIMGQVADSFTLSLDDGIPYYPTLSAIEESPLVEGVLYTGTDDGNVQVSRDGGATWTEVSGRMAGLPEDAWINGIEASAHTAARVYVTANNYRNDDYANYVYRSDDYGGSWTRIDAGLAPERVTRTLREDLRNPDVLYLGTELGLFWSADRGGSWSELVANLPTMAVNDLVIHPGENDLVLGTHGRGVWILDQINALQEMTPAVTASASHLFTVEPAYQFRIRGEKAHMGDMVFRGENPPVGALLDFWLGPDADDVALAIRTQGGRDVAMVPVDDTGPGVNRAVWNLRHTIHGCVDVGEADPWCRAQTDGLGGPLVAPGEYVAVLSVDGAEHTQPIVVREDPRLDVAAGARVAWTDIQLEMAALDLELEGYVRRMEALTEEGGSAKLLDLEREYDELRSRLRSLMGNVAGVVAPLTADQATLWAFIRETADALAAELEAEIR